MQWKEVTTIFGYVKWKRRANILLLFSASAASLLLLIAQLSQSFGDFTIVADNKQLIAGLSLAENESFNSPTVRLQADSLRDVDNITESDLPADIDAIDGTHNGSHYLAYTFYLKNVGEVPLLFTTQLSITQMIKEVDEAIRIRIYHNGEPTTYAKIGKNGLPEEIAPGFNTNLATPFQSLTDIVKHDSLIEPDESNKYTIVIWLEGWDLDCEDKIRSGSIQLRMKFTIVEIIDD